MKKKEKDDSDKFDAEMEAIYEEVKKTWAFYTPSNLKAETAITLEAQRRVNAEIKVTLQETEKAVAKLQLEDEGKDCNRNTRYNYMFTVDIHTVVYMILSVVFDEDTEKWESPRFGLSWWINSDTANV